MKNPSIQMEWLYETLEKRLRLGIKLEDLFLCIPYSFEAEFEYEIEPKKYFKGNELAKDYPALMKLANSKDTAPRLRVFLVKSEKLPKPLLLWTKKYSYPKVSLIHRPFNV